MVHNYQLCFQCVPLQPINANASYIQKLDGYYLRQFIIIGVKWVGMVNLVMGSQTIVHLMLDVFHPDDTCIEVVNGYDGFYGITFLKRVFDKENNIIINMARFIQ